MLTLHDLNFKAQFGFSVQIQICFLLFKLCTLRFQETGLEKVIILN